MSGTQRLAPRRSSAICGGYAVRRETPACLLLYSSQRGQGGGGRGAGGARAWVPPGARATSSVSGLASSTSTTCVAGRPRCASTCCSAARSWRTCSGVRANTGITTASSPLRSAPRGSLRALPHARTPRPHSKRARVVETRGCSTQVQAPLGPVQIREQRAQHPGRRGCGTRTRPHNWAGRPRQDRPGGSAVRTHGSPEGAHRVSCRTGTSGAGAGVPTGARNERALPV